MSNGSGKKVQKFAHLLHFMIKEPTEKRGPQVTLDDQNCEDLLEALGVADVILRRGSSEH